MVREARRTAPHYDVPVLQRQAIRPVGTLQTTEQERCAQSQRQRHDGRREIPLIPILMQRHARTGLIAVDETDIRPQAREARKRRVTLRELTERLGQSGPGASRLGIEWIVAIAFAVGDPLFTL